MGRHKKGGGGHGGGGGGGGHDAGGGLRWLLTYADVVTLLLALFVYLFSISTVNVAKFRKFGEAFAEFFDFGGRNSLVGDGQIGGVGSSSGTSGVVPMPGSRVRNEGNPDSAVNTGVSAKTEEEKRIEYLKTFLFDNLNKFLDMENTSIFERDGNVVLQLRDAALFSPGSAEVQPRMKVPLLMIAAQIRKLPNDIRIEGHTDDAPLNRKARFQSGWHISAARAASVVSFLSTEGGIAPERLSLSAFGEFRPLVKNYPNFGNSMNRRVEILLLAPKVAEPTKEKKKKNKWRSATHTSTEGANIDAEKTATPREPIEAIPKPVQEPEPAKQP